MTDEQRVQQLLDEILDSGVTLEEACGDYPDLLPEVRRLWQEIRIVEAQLNAMFPTQGPHLEGDTRNFSITLGEHPVS